MATATVSVQGCSLDGGGQQCIDIHICCAEAGIALGTSFPVNLARPVSQVVQDIKAGARQVLLNVGGPTVTDNDIYLFGGPT
jgi:hypothetical protein